MRKISLGQLGSTSLEDAEPKTRATCLCDCIFVGAFVFFSRMNASCEGHGSPWEVVGWEGGYLRQAWPPMVGPPPCRLVLSSSPLPLSSRQRLVFHPTLAMIMFTAIPSRLVGTTIMASAPLLLLTVIAAVVISVIVDLFVRDQLFYYSGIY